jgi:hypothetical protein
MKKSKNAQVCPICKMPKDSHRSCDFCYERLCTRCQHPLLLDESIRLTAYEEIHQRCKSQPHPRPAYMPPYVILTPEAQPRSKDCQPSHMPVLVPA